MCIELSSSVERTVYISPPTVGRDRLICETKGINHLDRSGIGGGGAERVKLSRVPYRNVTRGLYIHTIMYVALRGAAYR